LLQLARVEKLFSLEILFLVACSGYGYGRLKFQ